MPHIHQFYDTADGIARVALLCNAGAKFIDEGLNAYKEDLVAAAVEASPLAWYDADQGVQYIETCFGQVSFHIFCEKWDETFFLSHSVSPRDRVWSGEFMQAQCLEIAEYFIEVCCA